MPQYQSPRTSKKPLGFASKENDFPELPATKQCGQTNNSDSPKVEEQNFSLSAAWSSIAKRANTVQQESPAITTPVEIKEGRLTLAPGKRPVYNSSQSAAKRRVEVEEAEEYDPSSDEENGEDVIIGNQGIKKPEW